MRLIMICALINLKNLSCGCGHLMHMKPSIVKLMASIDIEFSSDSVI